MKKMLLTVTALVLLVAALALSQQRPGEQRHSPQRDGVFIHLTKGPQDAHAVVMALKMANLMAGDRDVLVYCDLEGINTVLRKSPDVTLQTFESSHAQIKSLLNSSVPIYACPSCLKALGHTPDELMDGVRTAEKEVFFSFTNGRILTLDY